MLFAAALLFTACPNNAGGSGAGGGGTPAPAVPKYKVELDHTIGGNVKVTPALSENGMAAENTTLTFTATPLQGYDLEKWEQMTASTKNGTRST